MTTSRRQHHWEKVYRHKAIDEVSWHQDHPLRSLELIEKADIPRNASIIDVGAGASMLEDHLLQDGYSNIAVLDISESAIRHARQRLGKEAGRIEWFVSDITEFRPPHRFHLWHDRAVFHFLTDAKDRHKYLSLLTHYLEPNGYLVIATFAPDGPAMCSGLEVVRYDRNSMQAFLGDRFKLVDSAYEEHTTPDHKIQKFHFFLFRYQPS
jgi:trans-aconitate methyltransferase